MINLICNFVKYLVFFICRLDVGGGIDLDLNECPRSKLKQQCIRYLGPVCAISSLVNFVFTCFWDFLI